MDGVSEHIEAAPAPIATAELQPKPFDVPQPWFDAYMFANTYYPQMPDAMYCLVAQQVVNSLVDGTIQWTDFQRSTLSPEQLDTVTSSMQRLHGVYSVQPAKPVDTARIGRLWASFRNHIGTGITRVAEAVAPEGTTLETDASFFNTHADDPRIQSVQAYLARIDTLLRSSEGKTIGKSVRDTVKAHPGAPHAQVQPQLVGHMSSLGEAIVGQIDQATFPDVQQKVITGLYPPKTTPST